MFKKKSTKKATKVAKKKIVKEVLENTYKITLKYNGEVFSCETNDIEKGLLSLKPEALKTSMVILIEKGELKSEQFLQYVPAKMLFSRPLAMEMFITRLIFS